MRQESSPIPDFPDEVNPNPVIALEAITRDGTTLRFNLPEVQQARFMWALGEMLARLDVPVDLALPDPEALSVAAQELLEELQLIEEGWAFRERGHGDRLNPWEKERLGFVRAAIAKAESPLI